MKPRQNMMMAMTLSLGFPMAALAGQTSTSAEASSNGRGNGTAVATADYNGHGIGFTDTSAQSGRLNFARGVSVGFDEDGLSLSTSYALAGQRGPAVAGTLNLNIGLDGEVSSSAGRSVAQGDRYRSVSAGGSAGSAHGRPTAVATASGEAGPRGRVRAETQSHSSSRDAHRFDGGSRRARRL